MQNLRNKSRNNCPKRNSTSGSNGTDGIPEIKKKKKSERIIKIKVDSKPLFRKLESIPTEVWLPIPRFCEEEHMAIVPFTGSNNSPSALCAILGRASPGSA